jgi:lysozyme family protein
MPHPHFISYSGVDGSDFALKLCDDLQSGPPSFEAWLDKRRLQTGTDDWDKQIEEAIRDCESLIFLMTLDSVEDGSVCKNEWVQALKYKKPILLVRFHAKAEPPFRLNSRQFIDFTGNFETGLARLRKDLQYLSSPRGVLQAMQYRLNDAQRDLRRASDPTETGRIKDEIEQLKKQIAEQKRIVENPEAAAQQTDPGTVLKQEPFAGARVKKGGPVGLVVATKPGSVEGPATTPDSGHATRVPAVGGVAWTVTKSKSYAEIEPEYRRMFFAASLDPGRRTEVEQYADRVLNGKKRYEIAVEGTHVPWFMLGIIHGLESGFMFDRHLHNGDPLTERTVHVPAGRPVAGNPPFTWEQSARDVIEIRGLAKSTDWSFTYFLYSLERVNGFGYRMKGMPSPYLWAGTDIYRSGKYLADGSFAPDAVSKSIGAAAILKTLFTRGAIDLR